MRVLKFGNRFDVDVHDVEGSEYSTLWAIDGEGIGIALDVDRTTKPPTLTARVYGATKEEPDVIAIWGADGVARVTRED